MNPAALQNVPWVSCVDYSVVSLVQYVADSARHELGGFLENVISDRINDVAEVTEVDRTIWG